MIIAKSFLILYVLTLGLTSNSPRRLQSGYNSSQLPICKKAQQLKCDFQAWKAQFGQSYQSVEEDERRHAIFCANCTLVMLNKNNYKLKLNKWAASTQTEIDHHFGLRRQNLSDESPQFQNAADRTVSNIRVSSTPLPSTFDYRNVNGKNYVTSVKDQGSCGSCWSFAATAAYESLLLLNGHDYGLSQEASLQCTTFYAHNQRVNDCSGGYFPDSLNYLALVGSVPRSKYPYKAYYFGTQTGTPSTPGICTDQSRIFLGPGSVNIYAPYISSGGLSVEQIKAAILADGPLMMGIYANTDFNFYCSGLFTGCPANSVYFINHAILLVGWTRRGWIGKNQWGTQWGNRGYIELDFENDCGMRYLLGSIKIANKNNNPEVVMNPNYGAIVTTSNTKTAAGNWQRQIVLNMLLLCVLFIACL